MISTPSSILATRFRKIENDISKQIGTQILDYLFLLSPESKLTVELTQLQTTQNNLLRKYIQIAKEVFIQIGSSFTSPHTSLPEVFKAYMHEVYYLRFLQATQLYTEYQITRVPTVQEANVMTAAPQDNSANDTFGITVPDYCLILDKFSHIDWPSTQALEKREHNIATILSIISEIEDLTAQLSRDFADVTTRGGVPVLFENTLADLQSEITQICLQFFTREVYKLLSKGQNLSQAKDNTSAYYIKSIQSSATIFPAVLSDLDKALRLVMTTFLDSMTELTPATKKDIIQEHLELVLLYIREMRFFATNHYTLKLFAKQIDHPITVPSRYFIDSYLIRSDMSLSSFPLERYRIDYSAACKKLIFETITNGSINPHLTLSEYLKA